MSNSGSVKHFVGIYLLTFRCGNSSCFLFFFFKECIHFNMIYDHFRELFWLLSSMAGDTGDMGSIPGSGSSPGRGHGNLL